MWMLADHFTLGSAPWLTSSDAALAVPTTVPTEPALRVGPVVCRWIREPGQARMQSSWPRSYRSNEGGAAH